MFVFFLEEISLKYNDYGHAAVFNILHETRPSIIHGNGPSKLMLNNYGNYIAGAHYNNVCYVCNENNLELVVSVI